jgi:opacity protein-like surface antigen
MSFRNVIVCTAGIVLSMPAIVHAAGGREGTWETSLGVAIQNSADSDFKGGTKVEMDSDEGFVLQFDYNYTGNLAFGVILDLGQRDYKADVASADIPGLVYKIKGDMDYTNLIGTATWNFLDGPFTPFVTAGLGWSWWDTNVATEPPQTGCWWDPWWGYVCSTWQDTKTVDGLMYMAGVGARFDINDRFAIHASYRANWIELDKAKGSPYVDEFNIMFGWKF